VCTLVLHKAVLDQLYRGFSGLDYKLISMLTNILILIV